MAIRRFQPGRTTGGILLCAAAAICAGCYQEIAYDPSTDAAGNAPVADAPAFDSASPEVPPAENSSPENSTPDSELPAADVTPEPPALVTAPVEPPPGDRYALADAANETDSATTDPTVEPELFPEEVSPPEPAEEVAATEPTPAAATQASSTAAPLLPWESEEPKEQAAATTEQAPQPQSEAVAAPQPSAAVQGGVFPWDEPTEPAPPEETPAVESEVQPSSASEQLPPAPAVASNLPDSNVAPEPARQAPATSRHAAWLLGSKLSYAVLAPADEANRVVPELQPLAQLLGVELPDLDYEQLRGTPAGMTQLLTVGRVVGEELGTRHDPSHAALVEIALKSNLLLAVYAERPHLAHSIGGSVAAACVRAGIPEEIWQPWQDTVSAGGSTEEITSSVLELHTQINTFLQNPPHETAEAILR